MRSALAASEASSCSVVSASALNIVSETAPLISSLPSTTMIPSLSVTVSAILCQIGLKFRAAPEREPLMSTAVSSVEGGKILRKTLRSDAQGGTRFGRAAHLRSRGHMDSLRRLLEALGCAGREARSGGRIAQNETAIMAGNNRIMIFGPKSDGTYVVEFIRSWRRRPLMRFPCKLSVLRIGERSAELLCGRQVRPMHATKLLQLRNGARRRGNPVVAPL